MKLPADLRYTASHEWVRREGDGTFSVGITDHAQEQLGDIVFIEPPQPGRRVKAGETVGVVESVKAASDIYSPVSGEIVEVNELLNDKPETINEDAFGDGWIFAVRISDRSELDELLDADAYAEQIENEDH